MPSGLPSSGTASAAAVSWTATAQSAANVARDFIANLLDRDGNDGLDAIYGLKEDIEVSTKHRPFPGSYEEVVNKRGVGK